MSDSVSGNQLLRMLGNRKLLILFITLVTFAVALAVTLTQTRKYTAESSILVELRNPQDDVDRRPDARLEPNYMTTQLGILSSRRVADLAVAKLLDEGYTLDRMVPPSGSGPDGAAGAASDVKSSIKNVVNGVLEKFNVKVNKDADKVFSDGPLTREQVIDEIVGTLDVSLVTNSRLMSVSYSAHNPELSALIANAIADSYVETRLAISQNPAKRIAEWMELQLVDYRENLTQAQDRLSKYQQEKGIIASDRLDVEIAYLNSLTNQLVEAEAGAAKARTRVDQIQRAINQGQSVEAIPEIYANKIIQDLKSSLVQKEGVLSELSAEYGDKHPRFLAVKADVEQLTGRLRNEITATVQGVRGDESSAAISETRLRRALNEQRQKLLQLRQSRGDLPALVREVENAQSGYETALEETQRFAMIGNLDETNALILNRATVPSSASSPRIKRNLLAAMLLGLLLGVILALILEMTQKRVRHVDDLGDLDGIPILAEIPRA